MITDNRFTVDADVFADCLRIAHMIGEGEIENEYDIRDFLHNRYPQDALSDKNCEDLVYKICRTFDIEYFLL